LFSVPDSTLGKFAQAGFAVLLFLAVVGIVLFIASRFGGRQGDKATAWVFLAPTFILVAVGLIYPGLRTIFESFLNAAGTKFIGVDNYKTIFTSSDELVVLRNTFLWVVVTPIVATAVGLVYAVLVDGTRFESFAKSLIFLPMAISFVGASIIWNFVYAYRPAQGTIKQIGLLNQILVWLGGTPQQWLLNAPWNTFFLLFVLIWVQAGFAMTILSASIKAIPTDIIEAATLDGAGPVKMFRFVTVPSIRPGLVVVLTTISIASLKVFDIVRTMTGGDFRTSVVSNEFYTQSFRAANEGLGAALATMLFILVIPIVVYNIRQLRASEAQ
jgi:alpha-glucoside transport system permease protein